MNPNSIIISSVDDISLANAERVALDGCLVVLGEDARATINEGRRDFDRHVEQSSSYIYGTNTAPGSRAKEQLTVAAAKVQGKTLREFITMRAGLGGAPMPRRTIRLAILARISNAFGGGKITSCTVDKILEMLSNPPDVPLASISGPGEVLALSWLMAPLADLPLRAGEAMALINGSPFATAMVVDSALLAKRRLGLAEEVFALSIEAARAPLGHYYPALADLWPDPFYRSSLEGLNVLLAGASPDRLKHQAPVSWRVIPNILAAGKRALFSAEDVSRISLRAVKDNPTFLPPGDGGNIDRIVSSGGFHDHQSARAIESLTSNLADLCVLVGKQVTRLIDGEGLGLPRLMVRNATDGVGTEYFVWTLTDIIRDAQQAAVPVGLDMSLEDPVGNQSDVASPAFAAYARHLEAGAALDKCLAALATVSTLTLKIRDGGAPPALSGLWSLLTKTLGSVESTSSACAEPLREVAAQFRARLEGVA